MTALILSPIVSQSLKGKGGRVGEVDEMYQRLGLLKIDCIRMTPWVETTDGVKVSAESFWDIYNHSARTIITIV